ncbi:MAG: M1 family metallopeptidase [Ignavibacteriales bacterium]|nr:M1 family metallopeptidase [Ignavibacteriales bacterium]
MRKRLILLISSIILLVVLIAGFLTYRWLVNRFNLPSDTVKLINLSSQLKNFDEKELAEYNPKTQSAIDVLHYQIKIDLYPEQKKIFGEVTIKMKVNEKQLSKIEINFYDNLIIRDLRLNDTKVEYDRSEKLLSIHNNNSIDTAVIKIVYEGTPKSLGFGSFNFEKVDNRYQVYTLSEPVFASTWFPCVDLPDDKALADIYITNDSSDVSLSNGRLIETNTQGARRTYHWKTFYPISTYLIALYSGNYKSVSQKYISISGDSLKLSYYALPENIDNAQRDFSDHPKYLKTFEELFGAYPFVKEKYSVAEFWWQSGAMENQTITGIGSNFISGRKFFSDMLIHELAHHWWGDAVGPKTWKDIWLNEGFATYSEALYWEKQSDIRALQSTLRSKFSMFPNGTLYNPGNALFSSLIYDKGAWVLHMLRREVGDEIFFKILQSYFKEYKYGNASTADFKNFCEKISKKSLDKFFDQWVYKGEGIIELDCVWSVQKEGEEFISTIKIKQLQKGYDIYKFPLDIKLISEKVSESGISTVRIDGKEVILEMKSKYKPVDLILDPDSWLLAKINLSIEENGK